MDQPSFTRAPHDAIVQRPREKLRKNRNEIKPHGSNCNQVNGKLPPTPACPWRPGQAVILGLSDEDSGRTSTSTALPCQPIDRSQPLKTNPSAKPSVTQSPDTHSVPLNSLFF